MSGQDLTGERFGKLLVLRRADSRNGKTRWLCRCDCGNEKEVAAQALKSGKTKSCGCLRALKGKGVKDISGKRFGRLTALYPTEKRNEKGSVYWRCKCDCGNKVDVTEHALVWGGYKSCGCLKMKSRENIGNNLHYIDKTCVEILEKRKHRKDNTSGFRGVHLTSSGKYKASIGFRRERYWLGTYDTFDEAVEARRKAEETLHGGFLENYYFWKKRAEEDPEWGKENPLVFTAGNTGVSLEILRRST